MSAMVDHSQLSPDDKGLISSSEVEEQISEENKKTPIPWHRQYKWWLLMGLYSSFVLGGQALGTLLGRVYFDNGGKSIWLATLVQVVGYPVLIPFQCIPTKKPIIRSNRYSTVLASIYLCLGIFVAGNCMLYTIGLQYIPVTTYTLICATQLGFNALFSFFFNGQKFTPFIINSIVLLTISSVLLVFQADSGDSNKSSKTKYVIGFLCTLGASAGYALLLSVTQVAFQKVIKKDTFRAIVDISVYESMVATFVILIGVFASGEWKKYNREMEDFKLGKVSYVNNLFWTAVAWQAFNIGYIGLIFKVSSLFSNVISILGLPLAPVLAVVFLRDKLTGLKGVSLLLAMWGFVSYAYQHYLDELEKKKNTSADEVSEVSLIQKSIVAV